MKTLFKITLLGLLIFFCTRCRDNPDYIKITNKTSTDIMVLPACRGYGANLYPDTTLPLDKPLAFVRINKNDSELIESPIKWEGVINELPADTLSMFYFVADSVILLSWDKIRSNYIVFKREDFSSNDLKLSKWTITINK
jgi:hypothetical protein